jgi:hypothetical protein
VGCPALPYFANYLINGTIFGEKILNINCVLIFSTISSETFLILRRTQRDIVTQTYTGRHVKYPSFVPDFNDTVFSQQIFEEPKIIKFHGNPSSGVRNIPCGQTEKQT